MHTVSCFFVFVSYDIKVVPFLAQLGPQGSRCAKNDAHTTFAVALQNDVTLYLCIFDIWGIVGLNLWSNTGVVGKCGAICCFFVMQVVYQTTIIKFGEYTFSCARIMFYFCTNYPNLAIHFV